MDPTDFAYWMAIVMLANVPPQLAAAYLFWRWRSHAKRPWVRNSFLVASMAAFVFAASRIAAFVFTENLEIRFLTSVYFVAGSYLIIGMFGVATRIMERRIKEARVQGMERARTSDLLGILIEELKAELKTKRVA